AAGSHLPARLSAALEELRLQQCVALAENLYHASVIFPRLRTLTLSGYCAALASIASVFPRAADAPAAGRDVRGGPADRGVAGARGPADERRPRDAPGGPGAEARAAGLAERARADAAVRGAPAADDAGGAVLHGRA
ncbi:hypothetical protein EVJ58_g6672, partial [Rhodofomes roseus]